METTMEPLTIGLTVASIASSLIGNIFEGEGSEDQLDAQIKLKEKEIDSQLRMAADKLKVDYETLKQQKDLYLQNMRETARQFDQGLALKNTEMTLKQGMDQQQMDLQNKTFNLNKKQVDTKLREDRMAKRNLASVWKKPASPAVPSAPSPAPKMGV